MTSLGELHLLKKLEASELVSRVGWLAKQPADFRAHLFSEASVRIFSSGKMLCESGTPAHALIGLVSGSAEVWLDHPQLNPYAFHVGGAGAWFGEQIALGLPSWKISVQARSQVCAITVPQRVIKTMIKENPVYLKYFGLLSHLHMRECSKVIVELLQQDAFSRICARLMTLGMAYAHGDLQTINGHKSIEIPITHEEFSVLCGISRRTLSRILSELKQAEAINMNYRTITILNLKLLGKIVARDRPPRSKMTPRPAINVMATEQPSTYPSSPASEPFGAPSA
jgi:CRP-like cAMP-binding protein